MSKVERAATAARVVRALEGGDPEEIAREVARAWARVDPGRAPYAPLAARLLSRALVELEARREPTRARWRRLWPF